MNGMRSVNRAANSQPQRSTKRSGSSILEIDFWMPSEVRAISPLVDRLMELIERAKCVPGAEFDVELTIREALGNAVLHGNQENPDKKVHIRCRCEPGNEISIVVTDEGKGFDFLKILGNGFASDPLDLHGRHPADESVYGRCALRKRRFGGSYAQAFASCVFLINVAV